MKLTEVAWLAGLIEGEGCFYVGNRKTPVISLNMTDEDIVRRAAALLEARVYGPIQETRANCKPYWQMKAYGTNAAGWMMTLYDFMGTRRREKIREVLNWRRAARPSRAIIGQMGAFCHPGEKAQGRGWCSPCYRRMWRNGELIDHPQYKQMMETGICRSAL